MSDDEDFDGAGDDTQAGAGGGDDGEFHFQPVDEDIQQMEQVLRTSKDGLILAIDCRKNMFKPYPDSGKTPWSLAMSIASTVMRRKVISGGKTQVGVLFWGTREMQNHHKFDHVFDLMSMDIPTAGKISQLDTFAEWGKTGQKLFQEKIGHQENTDKSGSTLENMLWLATFMFQEAKFTSNDNQRVWLFTNDDNPCKASPELRQKSIIRAKDLENANCSLTLWTMVKKEDRTFDVNAFWTDILAKPAAGEEDDEDDTDNVIHISSENDLADIIETTKKKEFAKRTLVSIPMVLGPNVELGVKVYAIVLEAKIPSAVALEEANAKPLKVTTRWSCKETSHFLTPDQILYTAKYGGVGRVPFSVEDRKRIKRFAPASLTILGFKPLHELPDWQTVRAPYFIRPDEKSVKGSSKAFVALLGAAHAQNVFAVARMINNKSAAPKLVALVPQLESLTEDNEVVTPMGFLVVVLPYADDIRTPTFPQAFAEASEEQVQLAKKVVLKLSNAKPFDPRDYENPALQKFWVNLEALALDKKEDVNWKESENDTLRLPNEEELIFDEDFVNAAQAFQDSYGGPGEIESKKPASRKRKAAGADDEEDDGAKPKKKATKQAMDPSAVDWAELSKKGKLESLTVPDLKVYLKEHGLPMSGTKAVLVERIKDHLEA